MPLFEFTCTDCGTRFEELVGEHAVECPRCGSGQVRKEFSTFGVGRTAGSSASRASAPPAPT